MKIMNNVLHLEDQGVTLKNDLIKKKVFILGETTGTYYSKLSKILN